MQARTIVTALAVIALGTAAVGPADAATKKKKPKPIKGSKLIVDRTPDPTGSDPNSGAGCDTHLPEPFPHEAPVSIKIPGAGKLKVSINNQLDWALEIYDTKGNSLGAADGGMPQDAETLTVKTKKAGTYKMHACNLGGETEVTMTWLWTPA